MKVVVDASNIAYHVKNENGQPQMSNILAAVKALEESEDEFVIIADASLRHDIDDKETYLRLLESENVEEVPAGNDADHFILDIGRRRGISDHSGWPAGRRCGHQGRGRAR